MNNNALRRDSAMFAVPPRPGMDPSLRRLTFGPIRPHDADLTWWERIFRSK